MMLRFLKFIKLTLRNPLKIQHIYTILLRRYEYEETQSRKLLNCIKPNKHIRMYTIRNHVCGYIKHR